MKRYNLTTYELIAFARDWYDTGVRDQTQGDSGFAYFYTTKDVERSVVHAINEMQEIKEAINDV